MSFRYDYSVTERWTEDDEGNKKNVQSACTVCHKWHKGHYGLEFSYRIRGEMAYSIRKLCPSCAKKYAEMLRKMEKDICSME